MGPLRQTLQQCSINRLDTAQSHEQRVHRHRSLHHHFHRLRHKIPAIAGAALMLGNLASGAQVAHAQAPQTQFPQTAAPISQPTTSQLYAEQSPMKTYDFILNTQGQYPQGPAQDAVRTEFRKHPPLPEFDVNGADFKQNNLDLVGNGAERVQDQNGIYHLRALQENSTVDLVNKNTHEVLGRITSVKGANGVGQTWQFSTSELKNPANFEEALNTATRFAQENGANLVVPDQYQKLGVRYYDYSKLTGMKNNIIPMTKTMAENFNMNHDFNKDDVRLVTNDELRSYGITPVGDLKNNEFTNILNAQNTPNLHEQNIISDNSFKKTGDIFSPNGLTVSQGNAPENYITLKYNKNGFLEGHLSPHAMNNPSSANTLVDFGSQEANKNTLDYRLPNEQANQLGVKYIDVSSMARDSQKTAENYIAVSAPKLEELNKSIVQTLPQYTPDEARMLDLDNTHPVDLNPVPDMSITTPAERHHNEQVERAAERAAHRFSPAEQIRYQAAVDETRPATPENNRQATNNISFSY